MATIEQNFHKALEATRNTPKEAANTLAVLMTICDNLAEISETLKDIKASMNDKQ